MGFLPNRITPMLDELRSMIPDGPAFWEKVERHDWRPIWALCKEIQEAFKVKGAFDTREEQQKAWDRFSALRQRASETADHEKEKFRLQSEQIRDLLVSEIAHLRWSPLDDIIFFFDPVTVEDMKGRQVLLGEAGRQFSAKKHLMLREHKDRIFELIQEVRRSFDLFWEKRKVYSEIRHQEWEAKQAAHKERHAAWLAKTEVNIAKNREKLEKAQGALERCKARIDNLEYEVSSADTEKWRDIKSGWLQQEEDRRRSIEESIERLEGWIQEETDRYYGAKQIP